MIVCVSVYGMWLQYFIGERMNGLSSFKHLPLDWILQKLCFHSAVHCIACSLLLYSTAMSSRNFYTRNGVIVSRNINGQKQNELEIIIHYFWFCTRTGELLLS